MSHQESSCHVRWGNYLVSGVKLGLHQCSLMLVNVKEKIINLDMLYVKPSPTHTMRSTNKQVFSNWCPKLLQKISTSLLEAPVFKSLQNPWASVSGQRELFKSILRLSCPNCENQLAPVKVEPHYVLNNEKGQLHTSNFFCPYEDEWGLWICFHQSMELPLASILKVARHARRLTQKTL